MAQETTTQEAKGGGSKALLDPADTAVLLIDHQSGLAQTVNDIGLRELRANVVALAEVATLLHIPIITTASVPEGPNGPLLPEIREHAPNAVFVPRTGEINAWETEAFVRAVRDTGKRTLVIAGVWTGVCVAFPALSARAEGYKVYAVMDASGDVSPMAAQATLARLTLGGIVPIATNAMVGELQRTWNRADAREFTRIYSDFAPGYRAVVESHEGARVAEPAPDGGR